MISSDKLTLITLEGPDKVGKSTIYQLLRRATGYEPLVVDRFIGSNWVYDQIYSRATDLASYFKAEEALMEKFNVICFCLTCNPKTLRNRIESLETGKDLELALKNFKEADDLFSRYFSLSPIMSGVRMDTTYRTPVEVVANMIKYMKEIGYDTDQWTRNLDRLRS